MTPEEVIDKLRERRVFVSLKPDGTLSVKAMRDAYTDGCRHMVDAYREKIVAHLRGKPGAPGNQDDKRRIEWLIDYYHRICEMGPDPQKVNLGDAPQLDGKTTWPIVATVLRLVDQDTKPGTPAHAKRMAELAAFHETMNATVRNPFDLPENGCGTNGADVSSGAGGPVATTTEPNCTMSLAEVDG